MCGSAVEYLPGVPKALSAIPGASKQGVGCTLVLPALEGWRQEVQKFNSIHRSLPSSRVA